MKHLKWFSEIILEKSIGSEDIRLKHYVDIPKSIFYKVVNIDPTSIRKKEFSKPGKYTKWLLIQWKKKNLSEELLNDDDFTKKLNYYLFIFSTGWYRRDVKDSYGEEFTDYRVPPKNHNDFYKRSKRTDLFDILTFKTLSSFVTHISELVKKYEADSEDSKFDVVYSDDNISVFVPLNFTASFETAKNTQWCSQSFMGYSTWNSHAILFRIIPKKEGYDKIKLTWGKSTWYMAPSKYPEISGGYDDINNPITPFNEINGKEMWQILVGKNMENSDRYDGHWNNMRKSMSLVSDEAKKFIVEYWKKNIGNKR